VFIATFDGRKDSFQVVRGQRRGSEGEKNDTNTHLPNFIFDKYAPLQLILKKTWQVEGQPYDVDAIVA
jgi:hypothetical protein